MELSGKWLFTDYFWETFAVYFESGVRINCGPCPLSCTWFTSDMPVWMLFKMSNTYLCRSVWKCQTGKKWTSVKLELCLMSSVFKLSLIWGFQISYLKPRWLWFHLRWFVHLSVGLSAGLGVGCVCVCHGNLLNFPLWENWRTIIGLQKNKMSFLKSNQAQLLLHAWHRYRLLLLFKQQHSWSHLLGSESFSSHICVQQSNWT